MLLLGQLGNGDHSGNWSVEADFEASTLEELTVADSAAIQRATSQYNELVLRDGERVHWRWQRGTPLLSEMLIGRKETTMAHRCHAKGCEVEVAPRFLFCPAHWKLLPRPLQQEVWRTYTRDQEIRKDPTPEYLAAQRAAVEAVAEIEGR
jgi:hypothetical protein